MLPPLRPRLPLAGVALAAMLGIVLADWWPGQLLPAVFFTLGWAGLVLYLPPRGAATCLLAAAAFYTLHLFQHFHSPARELAAALPSGPQMVRATGVVWGTPTLPRTWSRQVSCRFPLRLEEVTEHGQTRASSALVSVRWAGPVPRYGDRIAVLGSLRGLEGPQNPGEWDRAAYQHRHGCWQELQSRYPEDGVILSSGHGRWWQEWAFAAQGWICTRLALDLEDAPEVANLIQSMVLGARSDTPDDIRLLFQRTGTMHLFAVSGLNVGMFAALVWFVLKPLRVSRRAAVLILLPLLGGYALITGLSASCVRACLTAGLFLAGYALDRRPPALNSLAASALVILLFDTDQLFSTGFQFTYLIVLGLLGLATPLQQRLHPLGRPDPFLPRTLWNWRQRWCWKGWQALSALVAATVVGWGGSLGFSIFLFHLLSPAALLANLLAVPVAFGMLALAVGSLLFGSVLPLLGALFNNANWLLARGLLAVLRLSMVLPGAYWYTEPQPLAARCEFTVLAAGTGGAIHLRSGREDWLLDCGNSFLYDQVVRPFLHTRGVNRLDGLLLTHGDAQHVGAGPQVLAELQPPLVVESPLRDRSSARRQLGRVLAAGEQGRRLVWRGDEWMVGSARVRVLYPPPELTRSAADDKALVLMVEAEGRRALFMSDSGFATEQWLLRHEPDLRAEVLVKGQHPRDLSGTPDFLRRVQPQIVIAAEPEPATLPEDHTAWQRSVEEAGIRLFSQERSGAVRVVLRAEGVQAEPFCAPGETTGKRPGRR